MLITRTNPFTAEVVTLDLPVTEEQVAEWNAPNSRHIQQVFPNLTPDEREFILTGITAETWDAIFESHDDEEQSGVWPDVEGEWNPDETDF